MAGDWIKMRCDLQTHPKVVRILSAIRPQDVQGVSDKFRVIGGLHAVWTVFDQHSTDGRLQGYTPEIMDHVVGFPGLAQAMLGVGWLELDGPETLVMPEFCEHNGKSGKRRAEDQKRQAPPSPPKAKGKRIPDDFPADPEISWARDKHPEVNTKIEADKFRDYWASIPGQKGVKLDWPATWRNWIRRSAENVKPHQSPEPALPEYLN